MNLLLGALEQKLGLAGVGLDAVVANMMNPAVKCWRLQGWFDLHWNHTWPVWHIKSVLRYRITGNQATFQQVTSSVG